MRSFISTKSDPSHQKRGNAATPGILPESMLWDETDPTFHTCIGKYKWQIATVNTCTTPHLLMFHDFTGYQKIPQCQPIYTKAVLEGVFWRCFVARKTHWTNVENVCQDRILQRKDTKTGWFIPQLKRSSIVFSPMRFRPTNMWPKHLTSIHLNWTKDQKTKQICLSFQSKQRLSPPTGPGRITILQHYT